MTYFSREPLDDVKPKRIGFIGVNGVSSFDLLASLEAFAFARTGGDGSEERRCYETCIIGIDSKTFVSDSGAVINAHFTARTAPRLDTVIIPGGTGLRDAAVSRRIAAWLLEHAGTTRVSFRQKRLRFLE